MVACGDSPPVPVDCANSCHRAAVDPGIVHAARLSERRPRDSRRAGVRQGAIPRHGCRSTPGPPALVSATRRAGGSGAVCPARAREVVVTPEMLVAPAEQVCRASHSRLLLVGNLETAAAAARLCIARFCTPSRPPCIRRATGFRDVSVGRFLCPRCRRKQQLAGGTRNGSQRGRIRPRSLTHGTRTAPGISTSAEVEFEDGPRMASAWPQRPRRDELGAVVRPLQCRR
jgi:hypothetical protein